MSAPARTIGGLIARRGYFIAILLGALFFVPAGCAQHPKSSIVSIAPPAPGTIGFQPGTVDGAPGVVVELPHYRICSTMADRTILTQIGQVMEGALGAYQSLSPNVPLRGGPMECYIFQSRSEWAAFTKAHTGEDATVYLRVNRGGYTVGDWFVAYWIGTPATFSVAAHEGWHQYVARNLEGCLPPFLEEGMACLFEQVEWVDGLPRWNLSENLPRLVALRAAADTGQLYPLAQLVRMHAGQVVGKPSGKIEAFYAQSWAFARFLLEGDGGGHRAALDRMLADAARGRLYADSSREFNRGPLWDPATARPMLEHYLQMSLPQIEDSFARYVRQVVDSSHAPGFE